MYTLAYVAYRQMLEHDTAIAGDAVDQYVS